MELYATTEVSTRLSASAGRLVAFWTTGVAALEALGSSVRPQAEGPRKMKAKAKVKPETKERALPPSLSICTASTLTFFMRRSPARPHFPAGRRYVGN